MSIKKKIGLAGFCVWAYVLNAGARALPADTVSVPVANLAVSVAEGKVFVSMDFDVSALRVKSNREVLLTPWLSAEGDTCVLQSVIVAGRNRYFHHLRNGLPDDLQLFRRSKVDTVEYRTVVPYEAWMGTAELKLGKEACGCLSKTLSESDTLLTCLDFTPKVFVPHFVYLKPEAAAHKINVAKGTAYIDFPVNEVVLYDDYRRNRIELAKIRSTIDVIRDDDDTRIISVFVKGYASPEGKYENNRRLARERTGTLKRYVQRLYAFPDSIMYTDYEPEDWEGLERRVQDEWLEHRDEILAIIRSDRGPDRKDADIKRLYPADYAFLLREMYPALRHSDYAVTYEVRAYIDVDEIREIMFTAPQKLSLQELYLVAQSEPEGSDEYNEAFEIAVRMFPDDSAANLNAANIAMGKGDMKNAGRYLAKAGDAPEAVYARAVYAALSGDYAQAETLFRQAGEAGIPEAEEALDNLKEITGGKQADE